MHDDDKAKVKAVRPGARVVKNYTASASYVAIDRDGQPTAYGMTVAMAWRNATATRERQ